MGSQRVRGYLAAHLGGVDIVGRVLDLVVLVTEALDLGHHGGLDPGIVLLVRLLVEEHVAAAQYTPICHSSRRGFGLCRTMYK